MVGREGGSSGIDVVWIVFQRRGVSFYGLRFYGYTVLWVFLWICNDNDNCNVNGNGNGNGNDGEAL